MNYSTLTKESQTNLFMQWLIEKNGKSQRDAILLINPINAQQSAQRNLYLSGFKKYLQTSSGEAWAVASTYYQSSSVVSSSGATKPTIISAVPVNVQVPIGGPAKMRVRYNAPKSTYFRLDLQKNPSTLYMLTHPFPEGWNEGDYQFAEAGTNKEIILTFYNIPADWAPPTIKASGSQIVFSDSGSGNGELLVRNTGNVFWILSPDEAPATETPGGGNGTSKPQMPSTPKNPSSGGGVDGTGGGDTGGTTDTGGGGSTASGISQWIKDNWMIVLLIGALALLVVPGRSSKKED